MVPGSDDAGNLGLIVPKHLLGRIRLASRVANDPVAVSRPATDVEVEDEGRRCRLAGGSPYDGGMSTAGAPDTATFKAFQRGEDAAIRAIVHHYTGMVNSVAFHVLHDRPMAEEAAQQTFVQAWRAASRLDADRDIAPWLCTIARRVAIDIVRREGRRPATSIDHVDPSDGALVTLPPSETAAWEVAQVRLAIESLAPDERAIVRLQHLEGFTHQEIADRLGVALGTVKSRSFRAHRTLADRLAFLREESA